MTTPSTLSTLLNTVLDHAQDCLTDNDRTLPVNVFVSHNAPAWDCCDLLTVHLASAKPTVRFPPEAATLRCATRWAAEVTVTLLRCVPTLQTNGQPPTDADLNTSAVGLAEDIWALYHCLSCEALSGDLLD